MFAKKPPRKITEDSLPISSELKFEYCNHDPLEAAEADEDEDEASACRAVWPVPPLHQKLRDMELIGNAA